MIIIAIIVLIAGTVDGCFSVLPQEYRRMPPKLIWGTITAFVINVAVNLLFSNSQQVAGLLSIAAILLYVVFRGLGYLGLAFSFRAFGKDHPVAIAKSGLPLALFASVADA